MVAKGFSCVCELKTFLCVEVYMCMHVYVLYLHVCALFMQKNIIHAKVWPYCQPNNLFLPTVLWACYFKPIHVCVHTPVHKIYI